MRSRRLAVLAAAAAGGILVYGSAWTDPRAAAAAGADSESAVWTAQALTFVYQGFTTRYSCDGLRGKVRQILIELGARDVEVRNYGCSQLVGPDPLPGVSIRMSVLHPAGTAGGQAVPAHWKSVDLLASREPLDAAADCDLIGQIRRKVLPLFAIRSLEFHAACARGQVVIASTRLKTQVLAPDPSTAAAASASR